MLQYRKSQVSIDQKYSPNLILKEEKGNVSISGSISFNQLKKAYCSIIEITPDKRRSLKYYSLKVNGSPETSWIENGKIKFFYDFRTKLESIEISWLDDKEYPDIFNTQVGYISNSNHIEFTKPENNRLRYLWIYNTGEFAKDEQFILYPKIPLNYNRKLVVTKISKNETEELYNGFPITSIPIRIQFDLENKEYENFIISLEWFNSSDERVVEYVETEFVLENESSLQFFCPIIYLDDCYLNYFGKSSYSTVIDLDRRVSKLSYNGLLSGCTVVIKGKFTGSYPEFISERRLWVDKSLYLDIPYTFNREDGTFSIEIPRSLISECKESIKLCLQYNFEKTIIDHTVDLTQLYIV